MVSEKDLNADDLANLVADDEKEANFDDLLNDISADLPKKQTPSPEADEELTRLQSAGPADFANFNIDDFDAALNSYQSARAGKLPKNAPTPAPQRPVVAPVPQKPAAATPAPKFEPKPAPAPKPAEIKATPKPDAGLSNNFSSRPVQPKPQTIDESNFKENTAEQQKEILNWYSGELKDKSYKISAHNMPEFLDSDKTIRVIHVSVESVYGWNVFFDNGVFMSLRDLKEYQERHGEIPCQDGKIIYGNKSSTFERILKIVVYEKPRYFSYRAK